MSDTIIAPPVSPVDAPAIVAPRFGLLSVAQTADGPERWELGIEWEPLTAEFVEPSAYVCRVDAYTSGWPLVARSGETVADAVAFVTVGSYSCGSASRPLDEAQELAVEHLLATEERSAEWAIATGSVGNRPSFQGATDLTPAGGAVPISDGIGALEGFLAANYHSIGALHAPRRLAGPASSTGRLVAREAQRIETLVGNFVVFGGGYEIANVGPDGGAPAGDEAWIYATSRPVVRRSEPFVVPDSEFFVDRETNLATIFALRIWLVSFDPTVAAIRVDSPARPA